MIYDQIIERTQRPEKQLALLLDPDKVSDADLRMLAKLFKEVTPDLLMVGGSLVSTDTQAFVDRVKTQISLPVVLYPGSSTQYAANADAILFLSLISGRNAEFLISHHVNSAPLIKANQNEVIATGYMLIDGGSPTSVQYISQTQPIPADKNDIAIATALAGQYLGMKLIYMDAGSGAMHPIPPAMIAAVKGQLDIPLMVGGGLNSIAKVENACKAGADIIVIGNALEKEPFMLKEFFKVVKG